MWSPHKKCILGYNFGERVLPLVNKSNIKKFFIINTLVFNHIITFWRPGNLNLARRKASITAALYLSDERTLMIG